VTTTSYAPTLSVVIPVLNAGLYLGEQLTALGEQVCDCSWEIIVADNGSSDQSVVLASRVRAQVPNLAIVDASARQGQAHARNVGARIARGEYLVFVDADDVVTPGYLAAMHAALCQHEFVAASFDSTTLNAGWVNATRRSYQQDDVSDTLGFLPFAGGGGLGIRRSLFERIGGFDESWWGAGEDIDLCWRAQRAGASLTFVPGAVVQIRWRASLPSQFRQGRSYGRGEPHLYGKYRDAGMVGVPVKRALYEWNVLLRRVPKLRSRAQAGNWARRVGRKVGRVEGSARSRVLYL
jgi:glycosyltransferase involved in cell wall biosynthesis